MNGETIVKAGWQIQITFLFAFYFFNLRTVRGQHEPHEFGDVPLQELTSTTCSIDSAASAVILFDKIKVDELNRYRLQRHIRIKFLKNDALSSWANINIFYNNQKSISDIEGATYNLVGKEKVVADLDPKNIFKTKVNKRITKLSFALPKVVVGSVIEYKYTISSDVMVATSSSLVTKLGLNFIDLSWQFQQDIPAYWCEYIFRGNFAVSYLQGLIPLKEPKKEDKFGLETIHWIIQDVPAFHEEPHSLPKSQLIGKLYIDLSERTWSKVGGYFRGLQKYGVTPEDSSLLRQLSNRFDTISNSKVKLDSIRKYVKRKLKWNGVIDLYPDRKFGDVFISGYGSSCEINLIMMALLKKSGLSSYPVMLSTRDHGTIDLTRPRPDKFNDLITAVILPKIGEKKEETILLDGTDTKLSDEYIPLRCLNNNGPLINGDQSEIIPLLVPKSKTSVSALLQLKDSTKDVEGKLDISFYGFRASEERDSYLSLGNSKYEEKLSEIFPSKSTKLSISNQNQRSLPLKLIFQIRSGDLAKFSGDKVYLNPFAILKPEENFFKAESRIFPIDLGPPNERIYIAQIEIPSMYSIEELPKSCAFSLPNNNAKFSFNITRLGNTLNLTSQLILNKTVFLPEEYPALREFYNLIYTKQSETIVLRSR